MSLRLILVNSTRPASIGSVSSPAEIIRRQSSYVWSVTGTPKALEEDSSHLNNARLKCLRCTTRQAENMYDIWTYQRSEKNKLAVHQCDYNVGKNAARLFEFNFRPSHENSAVSSTQHWLSYLFNSHELLVRFTVTVCLSKHIFFCVRFAEATPKVAQAHLRPLNTY